MIEDSNLVTPLRPHEARWDAILGVIMLYQNHSFAMLCFVAGRLAGSWQLTKARRWHLPGISKQRKLH